MEKVLITGSLGFIGFSLCQELLERGYEVIGIDALVASNNQLYDEKLNWIGRNSSFRLIDTSIEKTDFNQFKDEVDVIYHFADIKHNVPLENHESSIEQLKKILSVCNEKVKIIYLSTSSIYGVNEGFIKETKSTNPKTNYAKLKKEIEGFISDESKRKGFSFVTFRLPTIYGPWQRPDMVYHQLMKAQLQQEQIDVDNDLETEDVLYIKDILAPLILAGENDLIKNETYHLATKKSGEWFRGKNLLIGKCETIEEGKLNLSNQKAIDDLHFEVHTSLESGLELQKAHIKRYMQHYES